MAKNFNQPVRMCISCREREAKNKLLRLQYIEDSLQTFMGHGRSFYLCKNTCFNFDFFRFFNIIRAIIYKN